MGENPSAKRVYDLPVETVNWYDSRKFCEKLGLALPSEAQWEYACRAGTTTPFAGTGKLDEMGWHVANSGRKPHPVGEKKANDFGVYDMHGNAWEWCEDTWLPEFYSMAKASGRDPVCSSGSVHRVMRGGSWRLDARFCRSSYRFWFLPADRVTSIGCRPSRPYH